MSERNFCERCGKRISALEWDIHTCTPPAQPQQEQAYKSVNPLGGPAKVFDAMANAIRAGDAYHAVLRQYGFTELQPQQEPVAWALEWSFNGDEVGRRLYDDETHCKFDAGNDGGVCRPLIYGDTTPPAQPAPVQPVALPFGVGGGLVAIKTLLSRDPCAHANTAIQMIDAMLAKAALHKEDA